MNAAVASFIIQVLGLLSWLIGVLQLVVVVAVIISWLVAFDVINVRNRMVYQIVSTLENISDRLLFPIRRFLPPISGLDLSPLVFLLACRIVQFLIRSLQIQIGAMAFG